MIIIYSVLGLVALLLLVAALLPKKFSLSASTTIKASPQEVRDYVILFKHQKNYSVRVMADPEVVLTYGGTDGTVGATQARESNDKHVGKGEQEIKNIDAGRSYEVEIRFEKPMVATHYAKNMLIDNQDGTTTITNTFWGTNTWPGNLFSMLFFPRLRKDMQQNMDNLKAVLEK